MFVLGAEGIPVSCTEHIHMKQQHSIVWSEFVQLLMSHFDMSQELYSSCIFFILFQSNYFLVAVCVCATAFQYHIMSAD